MNTQKNGANSGSMDFQNMSIKQKLELAAQQEQFVDEETVRGYLERDIQGQYVLLSEILASKEIIAAIAKVIYDRYDKIRQDKLRELQLEFEKGEK